MKKLVILIFALMTTVTGITAPLKVNGSKNNSTVTSADESVAKVKEQLIF